MEPFPVSNWTNTAQISWLGDMSEVSETGMTATERTQPWLYFNEIIVIDMMQ